MEIINGPTEVVGVDQIQPHPRNARQGDVGAIHESIASNGFYGAVVAQRSTGYILAGNHRWMAACAAGASEIPVTWVDVDDDRALRILLADNRTNDIASYDDNALADLLTELVQTPLGLDGTGFDGDALDELLADLGREDTTPSADPAPQIDRAAELQEQWGTARGQIWAIPSKTVPGKSHRLMCGDATSAEDVERLMGGEKVQMVYTDPPYGVEIVDGSGTVSTGLPAGPALRRGMKAKPIIQANVYAPIIGDDTTDTAIAAFRLCERFKGAVQIWWGGNHYASALPDSSCWIVWDKDNGDSFFADAELAWTNQKTAVRIFKHQWNGLIKESERGQKRVHPTQKPAALAEWCFEKYGAAGDNVLDLFGGSGSTLVGCENKGRVGFIMEMSPDYVAVILQRMTDMGLSPHRVTRDEYNG